MEKKITDTVKNIMKIGGAIATACVLLDEIYDKDELEKISIGENEIMKLTDGKQYDESGDKKEREEEKKTHENEIAELKKKISELEEKKTGQFSKEG